jgi:hypothetical protein
MLSRRFFLAAKQIKAYIQSRDSKGSGTRCYASCFLKFEGCFVVRQSYAGSRHLLSGSRGLSQISAAPLQITRRMSLNNNLKGDTSNELTMGTFLTSFDTHAGIQLRARFPADRLKGLPCSIKLFIQ